MIYQNGEYKVLSLGLLAISSSPSLCSIAIGDRYWKRIFWRIMRPAKNKHFIKMSKASEKEIDEFSDALDEFLELLETDEFEWTDEHWWKLSRIGDRLSDSQGRIIWGFKLLLSNCTDPSKDYLDFKAEIKQGLWLRNHFSWLIWLMTKIGFRPWD